MVRSVPHLYPLEEELEHEAVVEPRFAESELQQGGRKLAARGTGHAVPATAGDGVGAAGHGISGSMGQADQQAVLRAFVQDVFGREMVMLSRRLQRDAREELKLFLAGHAAHLQEVLANARRHPRHDDGVTPINFLPSAPATPSISEQKSMCLSSGSPTFLAATFAPPCPGGVPENLPGSFPAPVATARRESDKQAGSPKPQPLPEPLRPLSGTKSNSSRNRNSDRPLSGTKSNSSRNRSKEDKGEMTKTNSEASGNEEDKMMRENERRVAWQSMAKSKSKIEDEDAEPSREADILCLIKTIDDKREELEGEGGWRLTNVSARVKKYIQSKQFDYLMGAFLFANAITIGANAEYLASQAQISGRSTNHPFFSIINMFFCVLFTLEIVLRVYTIGFKGFFGCRADGWKSRWFDFMIVVFTILDEVSLAFFSGTALRNGFASFGFLRMLRLGRIARLIKMVQFIPELKSMVYLILASMGSFMWTCFLITALMYCFGVYFTELGTTLIIDTPGVSIPDVEKHWGSLGRSILTLYSAITGGDDWRNYVEVFRDYDPWFDFNSLVFSLYIAFAMLVMLNLVTGVFVDGAQKIVKRDKHDHMMQSAAQIFVQMELDSAAILTKTEFDELLLNPCMERFIQSIGVSLEDADKLFYVFDEDDSGDINLIEFVSGCVRLNQEAKAADVATLRYNQKEMLRMMQRIEMQTRDFSREDVSS